MTICVFAGPSLSHAEVQQVLPAARVLGPVRQGDVYRAVQQFQPAAIAIIDGSFQQVPAVWHKEILWSLAQGIPVYGAASMGALRAAELHPYGMIGIGRVFQAYRDSCLPPYHNEVFEDDDEVAVLHGPAELGYPTVAEAMVNIRCTLALAAEQQIISPASRDALAALGKGLFFARRTYAALLTAAADAGIEPAEIQALRDWLPQGKMDQKRDDALQLLQILRELPSTPTESPAAAVRFEPTTLWQHMVQTNAQQLLPAEQADAVVLEQLRTDPEVWQSVCEAALLHYLVNIAREQLGYTVDEAEKRTALRDWREAQGLYTRAALEQFLQANQLDDNKLSRLLENECLLTTLLSDPALQHVILDVLRLRGDYARLRSMLNK